MIKKTIKYPRAFIIQLKPRPSFLPGGTSRLEQPAQSGAVVYLAGSVPLSPQA